MARAVARASARPGVCQFAAALRLSRSRSSSLMSVPSATETTTMACCCRRSTCVRRRSARRLSRTSRQQHAIVVVAVADGTLMRLLRRLRLRRSAAANWQTPGCADARASALAMWLLLGLRIGLQSAIPLGTNLAVFGRCASGPGVTDVEVLRWRRWLECLFLCVHFYVLHLQGCCGVCG